MMATKIQSSEPARDKEDRLSGFSFMDLYLSADLPDPPMVRGLRPRLKGLAATSKGVTRVPDDLIEDVARLHVMIDRKWSLGTGLREFTISYDGVDYRCALIAPPDIPAAIKGEVSETSRFSWCVRQLSGRILSLTDLSIQEPVRLAIEGLSTHRGLVVVSGPFASGKTTLASSMIDCWVRNSREVGVSFEDPPELPLGRISETDGVIYQIDLMNRSMREAIKSSRRWSPRYVFLWEIRTSEATAEMLHMAISGPLVICTIHASDPVQAIVSLFRFAAGTMSEDIARDMISSSLVHVLHQELRGGRAILKNIHFPGTENQLMRNRIATGNFNGLYEDFDRQMNARAR
jgi:type IV secretory pathway ATPase VirB11/archaellum biosynthesis ATPase